MWDKKGIYYTKLIDSQINHCSQFKLQSLSKDNRALIQKLCLKAKLPIHRGCVNTVTWSKSGQYILSGSDDQHLCITDAYTQNIKTSIQTGHRSNIFSAKYLPNSGDRNIVSCSGDGAIIFTDIEKPQTSRSNIFNCHFGTTYDIVTVPNDGNTFLSCGEDATVRWFDIRVKSSCWKISECKEDVLINSIHPVTAITINHLTPYLLATGSADGNAYMFDRRMLGTKLLGMQSDNGIQSVVKRFKAPLNDSRNHRITSIAFSPDGQELLISYSWDCIYLFNINDEGVPVQTLKEKSMSNNEINRKPNIRRVRVRGDWSDTGPSARPENERNSQSNQVSSSEYNVSQDLSSRRPDFILQLSNLVTRIFNVDRERGTRSLLSSLVDTSPRRSRFAPENQSQNLNAESDLPPSSHVNDSRDSRRPQESISNSHNAAASTSESTKASKLDLQTSTSNVNFQNHQVSTSEVEMEALNDTESDTSTQLHLKDLDPSTKTSLNSSNTRTAQNEKGTNEPSSPNSLPNNQRTSNNVQESSSLEDRVMMDIEDIVDVETEPRVHSTESLASDSDGDENFNDNKTERKIQRTRENDNYESNISGASISSAEDGAEGNTNNDQVQGRLYRSLDEVIKRFREKRNEKWISMPSPICRQMYYGHRNARTMIKKATFWGNNYVMSGSDCGHIFIWDRFTSELVMILEADCHVVNCVQPHPFDPILASSGIDNDVKLWYPVLSEPNFNQDKAKEIIRINEKMLEETKDTVIVPASVIIRMMTSLSNITNSRNNLR